MQHLYSISTEFDLTTVVEYQLNRIQKRM